MTSAAVDVKNVRSTIWRVLVQHPEDLAVPQLEAHWFPPLIAASAKGPVWLCVVFSGEMKMIPASTTAKWIEVLSHGTIKLSGAITVSSSLAVRAAANAVSLAMKAIGHDLYVEAFKTEPEAEAWLAAHVK